MMLYLFEGFILTMAGSNQSGIRGRQAMELDLPFASIAGSIWIVIPLVFLAVSIRPIRKRLGLFQHIVHPVALIAIILPSLIFSAQSESIPIRDFMSHEAGKEVRETYDNRILFVSDASGTHAYIPRSLNRADVAALIYKLDPSIDPNGAEQGEALKP